MHTEYFYKNLKTYEKKTTTLDDQLKEKFKYVTESVLNETLEPGTEFSGGESDTNPCICPKCGAIYSEKGELATGICPKCGAKLEDAEKSIEPATANGQGSMEVRESTIITESTVPSPFDEKKKVWLRMLKEGKI